MIWNFIAPDFTTGDSWAGGAELPRIPGLQHTVVIRVLIHGHSLANDGRLAVYFPEIWLVSNLVMPPVVVTGVALPS